MTQVKCAQRAGKELALQWRASDRTLAQRRNDFAAQMRLMALSDLHDVAARLKQLHDRLNRKDGRKWTDKEITDATKIPMRTYQTWTGAKNENASGEGYEALARFYRRKLNDKTITRNWIVFGEAKPPPLEVVDGGDTIESLSNGDLTKLLERLDDLVEGQDAIEGRLIAIENVLETLRKRGPEEPPADATGTG